MHVVQNFLHDVEEYLLLMLNKFYHWIDWMVMVNMVYGQMLLNSLDEHQDQDVRYMLMDEILEAKKKKYNYNKIVFD